jgi:hypothetical protein
MIKNIQYRVSADTRGKIKSGIKNERGLPQSVEYFNIIKFPELVKAYGQKPTMLVVFFPTNRITDFFDCNYILWNKTNTKSRFCDGEKCYHRIAEDINGVHYEAGQESPCVCKDMNPEKDKKKMCSYTAYFKAYVAIPPGKVENPMCYLFETGSHNSGENVLSELEKMLVLTNGKLQGVPFMLSVKMVSGKDAMTKFPIWTIQPIGLISEIRNRTGFELTSTDIVPGLALPAHESGELKDIQNDNYNVLNDRLKDAADKTALQSIGEDARMLLQKEYINKTQFDKIVKEIKTKWEKAADGTNNLFSV